MARIRQAFFVSRQPESSRCTPDIENQIVYTYHNDLINHLIKSQKSHQGAVGSTPSVQYGVDVTASSGVYANGLRHWSTTYPSGRVLVRYFGGSTTLQERLLISQRLYETNQSGTIWAEYSHTGSGRTVLTDDQQPDLKLDLYGGTSGTYAGLDRFARTIDHRWYDYTSGTVDRARYSYGYDYAGNRLWKEDPVADANTVDLDDLSAFDGLHRLKSIDRGDLNGTKDAISTLAFAQDFTLDQLKNWSTFTEDSDGDTNLDLHQDRTHNDANEITQIDSASTYVAHDAAGNMTKAPKPSSWSAHYDLTWDAWDRLVKVVDGSNTVAEYEYDGLHRRIVKSVYTSGSHDHDEHFYLSETNQVLEVRLDSDTAPYEQFTWGERYVDDLVFRTRDTDGNGSLDETLYALHDANWTVTAIADTSGAIVERFAYYPYGHSTVLDGSFAADSDGLSDYDWSYRFTSREWDAETGLHHFRYRYYHDGLGRFIGRDPLEYIDGGNLYSAYFVPSALDPFGLDWLDNCANFAAGAGDSLTLGGTYFLRYLMDTNVGINTEGGYYKAGEYTETAVEITATFGAASGKTALKQGAKEVGGSVLKKKAGGTLGKSASEGAEQITKSGKALDDVADTASDAAQSAKGLGDDVIVDLGGAAGKSGLPNCKSVLDSLPGKLGKTGPIKHVPDKKAFDALHDSLTAGAKSIPPPGTYKGTAKQLPDGTIILMREESTSGGAALDIILPDGRVYKVHINQ